MRDMLPLLLAAALAAAASFIPHAPLQSAQDSAQMAEQSREVAKSFGAQLKAELVRAIKAGGPKSAIAVCNSAAPAIAEQMRSGKGLVVGRTALKLRNRENAPDAWERMVLEDFLKQAEQGADLAKLERYETAEKDGKRVFRYMKAIPTGKPCLTCHGDSVDAALEAKIREFYPKDEATGFALGDLRGAFTITQPLQ